MGAQQPTWDQQQKYESFSNPRPGDCYPRFSNYANERANAVLFSQKRLSVLSEAVVIAGSGVELV